MADSFADLWNSITPSSQTQQTKPQTLGGAARSASAQGGGQGRGGGMVYGQPQRDAFSLLAASQPGSRALTPSLGGGRPTYTSSYSQPQHQSRSPQLAPSKPNENNNNISGGSDAFSSLLSGSFTNSAAAAAASKLSLAERQALASKGLGGGLDYPAGVNASGKGNDGGLDMWSGLDQIGSGSATGSNRVSPTPLSAAPRSSVKSPQPTKDLWSFDVMEDQLSVPVSTSSTRSASTSGSGSGSGLSPTTDEFFNGGSGTRRSPDTTSASQVQARESDVGVDLDALDDFLSSAPVVAPKSQSHSPQSQPQTQPNAPKKEQGRELEHEDDDDDGYPVYGTGRNKTGDAAMDDFDFGDRENRLLDDNDGEWSDEGERNAYGRNQQSSKVPISRASPPPHVIGQIVEMGFTPQQARIALAATDTGQNVQEALENLLAASSGSREEEHVEREHERGVRRHSSRTELQRKPNQPPPQRSTRDRDRPHQSASSSSSHPTAAFVSPEIQERADKLLAQASEIGFSVFSRANALWKEGKGKVQKAYEERAVSGGSGSGSRSGSFRGRGGMGASDGPPKWMVDSQAREERGERGYDDGWRADVKEGGEFRDFNDVEFEDGHRHRHEQRKQVPALDVPPSSSATTTGDLLGGSSSNNEPGTYISPARRRIPNTQQSSSLALSRSQPSSQRISRPPSPKPKALIQRTTVSASSSAIASSNMKKDAGTEMFKLGRYAEAETHYSTAVDILPSNHLLLIPLLNNRAVTRLKTGNYIGAIDDCTLVINIVGGPTYDPDSEAKITKEEDGAGVGIAEGLMKAFKRRAEAWEGSEKWEKALKDWEVVCGFGFAREGALAKLKMDAVKAAGRCRRMAKATNGEEVVASGSSATRRPPAKPTATKPQLPITSTRPPKPSAALKELRNATQALESEDRLKHELKDSVDAKLMAWKGGKETNLRALIASLELVLWPELGWTKVSMAELISPKQVKVKYTRAIAKVHPDKLNANNTILEHRMIANGVFAALNDAWLSFKS